MTFIVGMGRSGTTMLTNMLNLNPEVIACPENEFVMYAFSDFKNKNFSDEKVISEFVNLFEFKFSKIISFWKPGIELKQLIMFLKDKSYANVCKQVYLSYPFIKNDINSVSCIIDKNPIYSLYLDNLNAIFPNSKFIVLTRDYRDNVLSRKKYSDRHTSIYILGASWNYFYKRIFKSIKKNNLNHYILRYEDLVENPSASLQQVCTFLEIEFSDKMLHFQDLAKDIKQYIKENLNENDFNKLNTMHSNLEQTISNKRVAAYKNEFTENEIQILDTICDNFGKKFNYLSNSKSIKSLEFTLKLIASTCKIRVYYFLHALLLKMPIKYRLIFSKYI